MKTYGLLGYPLGHSFSRHFFAAKFIKEHIEDCEYLNFSYSEISEAVAFLKSLKNLKGFNVTIPYKEKIIPFLHSWSETVEQIHSCNCITIRNGRWHGENTDTIGFEKSLLPLLTPHHNTALIFGTGGAAKSVAFVLKKLGIGFHFVSRTKVADGFTYDELKPDIISGHQILINTTPVGMAPNQKGLLPLHYEAITKNHVAYDLIYNPAETLFLKEAAEKGAITKNGLDMLEIQAEESWKIWNASDFP